MTPDQLAAIVARDAAVKFVDVTPTRTRVDAAFDDDWLRAIQDRRALLVLLRETREALALIASPDQSEPGPWSIVIRRRNIAQMALKALAALAEP